MSVTVKFAVPNVDAVNVVLFGSIALPTTLKCSTAILLADSFVCETPVSPVLENIILPVGVNVISSPTDRSPTIAPDAAFTSPVISTSAPAVISPDVFIVFARKFHLALLAPSCLVLALGKIFVSTSATNDTVSAVSYTHLKLPTKA